MEERSGGTTGSSCLLTALIEASGAMLVLSSQENIRLCHIDAVAMMIHVTSGCLFLDAMDAFMYVSATSRRMCCLSCLAFGLKDEEDGAGGPEPERPPEAGGGSSSMASGADDAMDTVS